MIIKSFEIAKIDLKNKRFFLLYGANEGHKNEVIENNFKKKYLEKTYYYDENEILNNQDNFFNEILSKSFFESEKLIIVNRASDKIKELLEEIIEKNIEDVVIVLNAGILEKKSKLRSLFEKNKVTVCIPFYEDNNQTLSTIISIFFRSKKIPISQQSINLIVERSRGDRKNLNNELDKVESFIKNKNKIEISDLLKLTNLAENYNVSELIDNCLAKNQKRTINILNENNYSLEDCILVIRTFLIKSKRLLKLCEQAQSNKDIDAIISGFKPPIFWKEKEIIKQQIRSWSYKGVLNLIFEINDIELLIKKNSNTSVNIMSDFIIGQATTSNN
jgi:DNA polymerase-3 subunit delta